MNVWGSHTKMGNLAEVRLTRNAKRSHGIGLYMTPPPCILQKCPICFSLLPMSWTCYSWLTTIERRHKNSVNIFAFSKDGKFLVTGCKDSVLSIFKTKLGAEVLCYEYDHEFPAIDCMIWGQYPESQKIILYVGIRKGKLYCYNEPQKKVIFLSFLYIDLFWFTYISSLNRSPEIHQETE